MENNFSFNLKHLRIQKGLTQEDLGKKLNKDYSTIGKWENGTRSPIMEDVIKIADFFNITLQELISGKVGETTFSNMNKEEETEKYKQILKNKGLMDENENIDEESLNKLLKIADMIDGLNNKED